MSYTVWSFEREELEEAADKVDSLMDQGAGLNEIRYQIMGDPEPLPFDTGYITDSALEELQRGFIVVEDARQTA